jgi:hypothetical protein
MNTPPHGDSRMQYIHILLARAERGNNNEHFQK